ncbi:hypothetical protein EVAR_85883_1 [Eumeta japonica]|uniref:Uncharacterized protein n=1 Tax=Eumeta variegata TaxID=151549 RepID=A0A4C2A6E8_EUMVA|nr:hypothetical protein EVAR_85883_1 [Eumeta japonica]
MKIEEKISVFTNTIRHAQRHRLTAGTSCQGPRRNERLERSESKSKLKRRQTPRSERASPRATPETGKNWKTFRAFNRNSHKLKAFTSKSECSTTEDKEKPRHLKDNERFTKV